MVLVQTEDSKDASYKKITSLALGGELAPMGEGRYLGKGVRW
jgi:hypothetical protein